MWSSFLEVEWSLKRALLSLQQPWYYVAMGAVLQLGQSRYQAFDLLHFDLLYEAVGKLGYRDQSLSTDCFSSVLALVTTKQKALEVDI